MKIVHLSTLDYGGAANSAFRLHKTLMENGVDSSMLVSSKTKSDPDIVEYKINLMERLILDWNWVARKKYRSSSINVEHFASPNNPFGLHKDELIKSCDIIHLHWVANFIDYPTFFKRIEKPMIWTLHDLNPIAGWWHYRDDEQRYQEFEKLNSKIENIKKLALMDAHKLTIVCPSIWIMEESKKSDLLGSFKHVYIPNGIDVNKFKPLNKNLRNKYNIPTNRKVLLLIADNLIPPRKGLDLFIEALNQLDQKTISVQVAGDVPEHLKVKGWSYLGYVKSEKNLNEVYNCADFTVVPSREDNLPNVVLESLAAGTPVIGFRIGGLPDMIEDQKNGFLADIVDTAHLSRKINEAINTKDAKYLSKACRQIIEKQFTLKKQSDSMVALYQSVVK